MVKTYWKLTALAGALVLLLAACQTTEAPTVVSEQPALDSQEWLEIFEASFSGAATTTAFGDFDGSIEILGTGMQGESTKSLTVPNMGEVQALRVQVALKTPPKNAQVRFENSAGDELARVRSADAARAVSGVFFEATFEVVDGAIDGVDVSDGVIVAKVTPANTSVERSFVALVLREDPGVQGFWRVSYEDIWHANENPRGYKQTHDETITVPSSALDRELSVAYALSDKSLDGRPILVEIEVLGGTPYDERVTVPNEGPQLYLEPGAVTSLMIPASEEDVEVVITVTSPTRAEEGTSVGGDSVWLVGFTANVRDIPPPPPDEPAISITKFTNGEDAKTPTGPIIPVGDPVEWTYEVTNTGDVGLTNVTVTDDQGVEVTCPETVLDVGESMTCTGSGIAEAGQYANIGTVTGTPPVGEDVSDSDPSHYFGEEVFVGCTLTRGYWQTHSKYGPAPYDATWALVPGEGEDTVFFLSEQTYYEVMWTAPRGGNAYYILAPQWIAAYLNVLNGAALPADVEEAWLDAQALFELYTPDEVGARGFEERDTFVYLAGILDDYNNGLLGVPHCDALD